MKKTNLAVLISLVTFIFYVSTINVYAGEEKKATITMNKVNYVFYEDSLDFYPDSDQVNTGYLAKDVTVVLGDSKLTFQAESMLGFYKSGGIMEGSLSKDTVINGIKLWRKNISPFTIPKKW